MRVPGSAVRQLSAATPSATTPAQAAGFRPMEIVQTTVLPRTIDAQEATGAGQPTHSSVTPVSGDATELYDFLAPSQQADELGRLGPYRVLKVLGAGGMGVVFQAEDVVLGRKVALKAILPGLAASATARLRFLREARAAAALEHDHIVLVYKVGEDRGVPFIAMPLLKGEPLEARLRREPRLPLPLVLRLGREIALGLAVAHKHGLVHRDIKPANLWLEEGSDRIKILDFGLARAASDNNAPLTEADPNRVPATTDASEVTQAGAVLGTPAYMAPEQALGKPVDSRCDLFSLGCVLYRLCTGELPFKGNSAAAVLFAVAEETPAAPSDLRNDVPRALSDLVIQLLAKRPAQRPESAEAVAHALGEIEGRAAETVLRAEPATEKKRTGGTIRLEAAQTELCRPLRRHRRLRWLAGGALLGLGVVGAAVVLFRSSFTERNEENGGEVNLAEQPLIEAVKVKVPEPANAFERGPIIEPKLRRTYKNSNGDWRIDGGAVAQEFPQRADCTLAFGDFTWKDYDFSCEAKKVGGFGEMGIVYRVTNTGRGEFILGRWGGIFESAGAVDLEGYRRLLDRNAGKVQDGRWYKLGVRIRGTRFQCFVDDKLAFDFDDPKHPQGGVGVRTWSTLVRFRNFRVTDPDGKVLFEGLPELPARKVTWIRDS